MSLLIDGDWDMKKLSTTAVLVAGVGLVISAFAPLAIADHNHGTVVEATVLSVEPVYRTVRINNPVEQCWDEKVHVPARSHANRSYTPKILGAIVGAAVGNEFGKGRGKDLATVAGAVLGGSVGRDIQNQHRGHNTGRYVYEQRCETVDNYHTEQQVDGYDVTYRYDGQIYHTQTARDPGATIAVSVSVTPVE